MELDLGSLASVQRFAQAFTAQFSRLHVLVANAGLMGAAELSEDGLEMEFAVNHLGHHFLTKLLMPTLKRSAPSRVVVVASAIYVCVASSAVCEGAVLTFAAARSASFGQLFLDNVRRPAELHALVRYARSKFANILFASTLARRLEASEVRRVGLFALAGSVHLAGRWRAAGRAGQLAASGLRGHAVRAEHGLRGHAGRVGVQPRCERPARPLPPATV